ncbi:MAG: tetratricopeptide repeat protein [Acidobacteriaceae bacterium]
MPSENFPAGGKCRERACGGIRWAGLLLLSVLQIFAGSAPAQNAGSKKPAPKNSASTGDLARQQQLAEDWHRGTTALQQNDNPAAEEAFRQAFALAPKSIEVINDLAISLARQGKDDEAIALYERALRLKPGDPVTGRNLGVAYFRAHRYKDALPYLEALSKAMPTFQALDLTGLDLFALDRYKQAIVYLEQASMKQPSDLPTLDVLGKAYWRTKNYSGVTKVFDRIMAVNPGSPEAHFMMGLAYDVLSKEDDAFKEFQAVLAEDPNYPGVHSSLGLIDFREHKVPQALDEFKQELTRYPNDPVSNYMVGRILRQQNQPAQAIPYLQAAIAVNPNYRDALLELGQCHILLDQPEQAIEPLKKATQVDPEFAQAHFVLGTAYSMAGQTADARRERNVSKTLDARQHEKSVQGTSRKLRNAPSAGGDAHQF